MNLYGGIDLHSNNSYIAVIDENEKVVYQKRIANDSDLILQALAPYQNDLTGLVIESTYNWYWLADCLQENKYQVHLANTTANIQYNGLKYSDDKSDARWLANLLRLNILETGYIYPKEERGLRELLRKRIDLVQRNTSFLLTIQSMITRYSNIRLTATKIKRLINEEDNALDSYIIDSNAREAGRSYVKLMSTTMEQIARLEKLISQQVSQRKDFKLIKTVPGVGDALGMTILLETGDINRFSSANKYSSYVRCVDSKRISNNKRKGTGNKKNGNAYLSWAFMEASNLAVINYPEIRAYYQRKLNKSPRVVALKALANKLAKASFFILRDEVEFDMTKLFR
jgi:transposase